MANVVVTGSRHWTNVALIEAVLSEYVPHHDLHVGDARGVDTIAAHYARKVGGKGRVYKAKWDTEGKGAGPRRNARMLESARPSLVIAFRLRDSATGARGTDHCVREARRLGIPVVLIECDDVTAGGGA